MDIFPKSWLHWIKVLSSWYRSWHSSPICPHLCVWYFPEKNQPPHCAANPAVSRCFQTAQAIPSGTTFTPVQDPRAITWGDQSCAEILASRRMPQSAATAGAPTPAGAKEPGQAELSTAAAQSRAAWSTAHMSRRALRPCQHKGDRAGILAAVSQKATGGHCLKNTPVLPCCLQVRGACLGHPAISSLPPSDPQQDHVEPYHLPGGVSAKGKLCLMRAGAHVSPVCGSSGTAIKKIV